MFRSNLSTLTSITALTALMLVLAACNNAEDNSGQEAPAASAATPAPAPLTSAASCDRQCLTDATDSYVAAIVAHQIFEAPITDDFVFVENGQKMLLEGLWLTAVRGPDGFVIHVPDEINNTVGYLALMTRMAPPQAPQGASPEQQAEFAVANPTPVEQPVIVAMRLRFFEDSGKIIEAEHLLSGVREAQFANLQTLRPGILNEIPVDQRLPQGELIAIGASYYDALDDNNGELAPFAPDCERHENGMITASGTPTPAAPAIPGTAPAPGTARDCRGQLTSGTFKYIDRIDNRRVFAADPQTGLVMGLSHFRHPMDNLPYEVTNLDGTISERTNADVPFAPFDLPAAHIFKVGADRQIHEIEAMGFTTVYNAPTGWE
jgi:hypothetical protein